jgi:hypothetical protein
MIAQKELKAMSIEKLQRKEDQAWEMAGLARQDGDKVDEKRHTDEARQFAAEINARIRAGQS